MRRSCAWQTTVPRKPLRGDTPNRKFGDDRRLTSPPPRGLEADNLLAFLALLGLLRALEVEHPKWCPRAAWDVGEPPLRPVLILGEPTPREAICAAAAEGMVVADGLEAASGGLMTAAKSRTPYMPRLEIENVPP